MCPDGVCLKCSFVVGGDLYELWIYYYYFILFIFSFYLGV